MISNKRKLRSDTDSIKKTRMVKNSLRVLAIGDLHYKVSNIKDLKEITDQIIKLVTENTFDFVVCLGDTLDRHETIHITPLTEAVKFLRDLSRIVKTILIIGNHDRQNNSDFLTDLHPFNSLKEWDNILVVDEVKKLTFGDRDIVFVPYVPNGRFQEALDTIEINNKLCIFCHQEFYGCNMNSIISSSGDKWENKVLIISGHIHKFQILQDNIIYVGTPLQHTFGEESDKSISRFDFKFDESDFSYDHERIYLDKSLKLLRIIKFEDFNSLTINGKGENNIILTDKDSLKIFVTGTSDEIKTLPKCTQYKKLSSMNIKILPKIINSEDKSKVPLVNFKRTFMDILTKKLKTIPGLEEHFKKNIRLY